MASDAFKIEIGLLTPDAPQVVDIRAVDRSILSDNDVKHILDELPEVEARIDTQSHKPYLGVDIFYGKDASVKGLVFATQSRALVVRVPDNAAKMSAALYEQKKAKAEASKGPRTKGKPRGKEAPPEITVYDRLRRLLEANLVAFGMAQISLTLWDTLHEKVEGVNLSTATSPPLPPPARVMPDPNAPKTEGGEQEQNSGTQNGEENRDGRRGRGRGRGGRGRGNEDRGGRGGRGGRGRGRGRGGGDGGTKDKQPNPVEKMKTIPVELPEDREDNWDRNISSPGDVVKKIYQSASRLDVNSAFIGQPEETDMQARVGEAVIRAWISYVVADQLNLTIQEAPVIKPSRLTDEELNFFSKSMIAAWKVMGDEGAGRVIEQDDIKAAKGNKIESKFHKSKIRPGKNQAVTMILKDGTEKVFYIRRPMGDKNRYKNTRLFENEDEEEEKHDSVDKGDSVADGGGKGRGKGFRRKGLVREENDFSSNLHEQLAELGLDPTEDPLFDLSEVKEISLYGREDATMPEVGRDTFVLRLLEGRGALHGPEYDDDCEFIRRIWFPTPAQLATGQRRKEENTPAPQRKRHDWIDDSWDDDTDEEELARRNKVSTQDLADYDTEDDDLGDDLKLGDIKPAKLREKINESQRKVIGRMTAPNPRKRVRATLVHGPPGTGKTQTIAAAVIRLANAREPVWIVAQSNVGIRNVADKLRKVEYEDFVLIVAQEYFVWWENRYAELKPYIIKSSELSQPTPRTLQRIQSAKMVLSTLASLSNPQVEGHVFACIPLGHLIIDEASQIDMASEFMHLFYKHRYALKSVCWFGDPMQLPPYGWSEDRPINDIFKVEHLLANSKLLDTSYRLPIPIAKYISRDVYNGKLKEWKGHPVKLPTKAILFIDIPEGEEEKEAPPGTSSFNHAEADLVVDIVKLYYDKINPSENAEKKGQPYNYEIITPYEAQRSLVAKKLKEHGYQKEVYNVDSFQGNEAEYIITTLTKTTFSSFLTSINRLNVLITRCQRGLIVLTRKDFVTRTGGLLRGLWWSLDSENIWATSEDVRKGYVDLPGSPAPNEPGSSDEESDEEEDE